MTTEQEKIKIKKFMSDEKMVQAVKNVLLSSMTDKRFVLDLVPNCKDNKQLGENVKAVFMGIKLFENGFKKLLEIGKEKTQDKKENKNPAV